MKQKIELGKTQELIVTNPLGGDETGHILLPKSQVPEGTGLKDSLVVFVYKDSEDRPIATMQKPLLELGGVARLHVKEISHIGAFLEWGLCSSMKVYELLRCDSPYNKDDEVDGKVYETSDNFGVFIAVDDKYSALLPKKEVFETYHINQPVHARVAQVLEDGRLTLSVKKKIPEQMNEDAAFILGCLKDAGGFLPFNDKSGPNDIKARFHMSKNAFKRATGHLLKDRLITIESDGIHMV